MTKAEKREAMWSERVVLLRKEWEAEMDLHEAMEAANLAREERRVLDAKHKTPKPGVVVSKNAVTGNFGAVPEVFMGGPAGQTCVSSFSPFVTTR